MKALNEPGRGWKSCAVNIAQHLSRRVPRYQQTYERIKNRKPPRKGHLALVATARDFVTNVLYDTWCYMCYLCFFEHLAEILFLIQPLDSFLLPAW